MNPVWIGALARRFHGRAWLPWALLGVLIHGHAVAADELALRCRDSGSALHANGSIALFGAALKSASPRVAVLGTGSAGQVGAVDHSWPETFKEAMARRLPGAPLQLSVVSRKAETAEQQLKALPGLLAGKPSLLVWQTGTVDAVRHIDVVEFSAVLIDGIDQARRAGADIVLVGPQFSPRAGALVNFNRHIAIMAQIARAYDVPFLDRYALMQDWAEDGRVDLAGDKDTWPATAKFVHDCVGRQLADLVATAAGLDGPAR